MTGPEVPEPPPSWAERMSRLRPQLPLPQPRPAVAAAVAAAVVVVVVLVLFTRRSSPPPALSLPRAGDGPPAEAQSDQPAPDDQPGDAAQTVTVHAAGAVARPGVYVLPGRARVADVVAAAGGTLADADVDQLNLAARLTDAQRVYVPRKGETPPPSASDPAAGGSPGGATGTTAPAQPLDLNTATAAELDVLPGVGPATAQAIVAHRTEHGRFRSVSDLLSVRGIGPAKLEAIRPLVRVGGG